MTANGAKAGPLVVARDVSKSYPRATALAPTSITVEPGETVALAGPSGSGKTTLLNLLAGLVPPDTGEVVIGGRSLSQLKPGRELARLVGLIHQQYDLVPQLPVIHNVLAGRLGQWGLVQSVLSLVWAQDRQETLDILGRLGIADKINERTSHLSGGEQQRVAIARLMVQSPRLVLADEPVASLDPARAEEMLALLTGLTAESGKTLIVSLHSPHLIRKYCSRIIGLSQGRLEFDVPTSAATEQLLDRLYDLDQLAPEVVAEAP